jgi:hypothetical protein
MSSLHAQAASLSRPPKTVALVLAASWLLFFVLGVWGHLQLHNDLAESLFKSLQLFHLHYHPAPGSEYAAEIPWTL